jgi:hypothetical protein
MNEKQRVVDPQVVFTCPQALIEKADRLAEQELISRAAFLRRLLAERVRQERAGDGSER